MWSATVSSRFSNKTTCLITGKEGAIHGTLLLVFLLLLTPIATAHIRHRDTLGIGERIWFVENQGQWNERVRFCAQMHNAAFFAEEHCFTIAVRETPQRNAVFHHTLGQRMHAYRVHFVNTTADGPVGRDIDSESGYDNYYYGHDPARWVSRLPHYQTVYYSALYPGIDMDVRVAEHAMKSNFYVAPGADPSVIAMRYEGQEGLLLSSGNLVIRTSVGDIIEIRPYAYQEGDQGVHEVEATYYLKGDELHIRLGDYDKKLPLVIDPVLHFSTYTGSTADNWGTTATYDSYKNTYTAGLVFGIGYPVSTGAYDGSENGNADIGIFKFDTTGTQRLFATYLGGSQADMPHSLYVNSFDELVIFGTTGSADFPVTAQAFDTSFNGGTPLQYEGSSTINFPNGSDIFVSRFTSDGAHLDASTYVGGTRNDGLNYQQHFNNSYTIIMQGNDSLYYNYGDGARGELITDDLNNVYVGSTTMSFNFPTTEGSVQPSPMGGQNGVVFKLDYNLRNMIWCTYLGGSLDDAVYSIDVDTQYNLLVCGGTNSPNFPVTAGAYQTTYGGGSADGFVSKISYNGERLMTSTFYGSTEYDQCYFVRTGGKNEIFLYGQTKASGSTMVYNANYNVPGSGMLLARLQPDMSGRVWSTVFGTPLGRPNLSPTAFAADLCNRVYAAGWGRDFVGYNGMDWNTAGTTGMETTAGAINSTTDGQDFYIMSIDANASRLDYATFFGELHGTHSNGGGDHVDGGTSRFDKMATLYQSVCASCGGYNGFPTTPNAWSDSNLSYNCNNALFRLNIHDDFAVADFVAPPVGCTPYNIHFHNTGRGTSFHWDFGDGTTSTDRNPTHTYTHAGTYTVRLIAHLAFGCRVSDTIEYTVWVLSNEGRRFETQAVCSGDPVQIGLKPMLGCGYEWISGEVSDSSIANPFVTHSGTYLLRITSIEGCDETDTFTVNYISLIDSVIVKSPTCPGGDDGQVTVILSDQSSEGARIYWDGVPGGTTLGHLSADGREHTVAVENHGCHTERTFTITDPPVMQTEKEAFAVLCTDSCDAWLSLTYGYPNHPVGDTLVEGLCEGTYVIQYADTAGCPYADTTTVTRDHTLDSLQVWADDTLIFLTESTRLHASRLSGVSYSWNPSNTLENATSADPTATPEDTVTTYTVTVSDKDGCSRSGCVTIHCTEVNCGRPNIFIPNVFSPNGDGVNDELCFRGDFVLDFSITIFSRWGEKVYEGNDIHGCWDGRYNGNWCMPGVYTYVCRVKCEAQMESLLKGDITLIR